MSNKEILLLQAMSYPSWSSTPELRTCSFSLSLCVHINGNAAIWGYNPFPALPAPRISCWNYIISESQLLPYISSTLQLVHSFLSLCVSALFSTGTILIIIGHIRCRELCMLHLPLVTGASLSGYELRVWIWNPSLRCFDGRLSLPSHTFTSLKVNFREK